VCGRPQASIPLILKQNLMFDAVANVKEMIKEKISASAWNLTSVEQLMT
jgi:hypothetical protein